jgi:hypothetical protein
MAMQTVIKARMRDFGLDAEGPYIIPYETQTNVDTKPTDNEQTTETNVRRGNVRKLANCEQHWVKANQDDGNNADTHRKKPIARRWVKFVI